MKTLRADRPGFDTYVTGQAAALLDFQHRISSRLPYALGLIAASTFILLFLMTGSVLVPVKALAMNTLSLGATFGALVWVFQDGHLSGLLGFTSFGAIEAWVPVLVFVFGFGLSMDYEVFLLSRIKEGYDRTGDTNGAVATGLQRSGRIITSAAVLVLIVFLGFVAGENVGIKEMGLALAVAVAVDATLVRCLLVPATMTLIGRANWWAPAPLRRLHDRFGLSEARCRPSSRRRPARVASSPQLTARAGSNEPARASGESCVSYRRSPGRSSGLGPPAPASTSRRSGCPVSMPSSTCAAVVNGWVARSMLPGVASTSRTSVHAPVYPGLPGATGRTWSWRKRPG